MTRKTNKTSRGAGGVPPSLYIYKIYSIKIPITLSLHGCLRRKPNRTGCSRDISSPSRMFITRTSRRFRLGLSWLFGLRNYDKTLTHRKDLFQQLCSLFGSAYFIGIAFVSSHFPTQFWQTHGTHTAHTGHTRQAAKSEVR